jgi:hypothetical protein
VLVALLRDQLLRLRPRWVRDVLGSTPVMSTIRGNCTKGAAACAKKTSRRTTAPRSRRLRNHDGAEGASHPLVSADGSATAFPPNAALTHGRLTLNHPMVGMAFRPAGGYWEVASDGGIFAFSGASFAGSIGGRPLDQPIVGMAVTPDSKGYWEVASDGGIFSFGSAAFYGSMGGKPLNRPIVGMAPTGDGKGYWEVASDGGIFSFGDAAFYGSTGSIKLDQPIVGMTASASGHGYYLVASDGGVFTFGDARFYGAAG